MVTFKTESDCQHCLTSLVSKSSKNRWYWNSTFTKVFLPFLTCIFLILSHLKHPFFLLKMKIIENKTYSLKEMYYKDVRRFTRIIQCIYYWYGKRLRQHLKKKYWNFHLKFLINLVLDIVKIKLTCLTFQTDTSHIKCGPVLGNNVFWVLCISMCVWWFWNTSETYEIKILMKCLKIYK